MAQEEKKSNDDDGNNNIPQEISDALAVQEQCIETLRTYNIRETNYWNELRTLDNKFGKSITTVEEYAFNLASRRMNSYLKTECDGNFEQYQKIRKECVEKTNTYPPKTYMKRPTVSLDDLIDIVMENKLSKEEALRAGNGALDWCENCNRPYIFTLAKMCKVCKDTKCDHCFHVDLMHELYHCHECFLKLEIVLDDIFKTNLSGKKDEPKE